MQVTNNFPVSFTKSDVEIIAQESIYSGFFLMNLCRFKHRLFNGKMSHEITREIFDRGHTAILLPFDPIRDEIILIEQIRIAAFDTSESPWILEMIAGIIEKYETPEDVIRREAIEEAGLVVWRTKPIFSYLVSPGSSNERSFILIGEVDTMNAKGIHGIMDENEDIRVHVVSRKQAFSWVEQGKIDNAASIIALQWLQLHYQELRNEWKKMKDCTSNF